MPDDILITDCTLLPMTGEGPALVDKGFIAIKDGAISALGPMADLPESTEAERTIAGAGRLAMPGLVNTHTHAPMTLFRGMADDLPLMTWLNEHIFPAEARSVNPEMVYWCSRLAAAEMLLSGTTTVADGYFLEDSVGQALAECGMRAVVAQGIIDFPAPGVPDPSENVAAAAAFIDRWQMKNRMITPALFCHSPYTCSADTLTRAKDVAYEKETLLFVHVAETRTEMEQVRRQHGMTPVRYLDSLGILDPDTVCVHCVWIDAEEIDMLAERGAKVSTCPQSNMKLASGRAPLRSMLTAGIAVGLGTDGCASNNTLDLFTEMYFCAALHNRQHSSPDQMPADIFLRMATMGGAAVLGLENILGSLAPGKKADLILLDRKGGGLQPYFHEDVLGYGANGADVRDVIINGRLVVEDRRVLSFDVDETMAKVRELAESLK